MDNLGKKYEDKFESDWEKIPNTSIDRLYDPVGGYSGVRNICDFIVYNFPYIVYAECKSTKGNTFSLTKWSRDKKGRESSQYKKLKEKIGIKGVIAGLFIWFYDRDKVFFVPIATCKQMIEDGEKSVNCKKIVENKYKSEYRIIEIPSVKKRVFMDSDYSVVLREEI